MKSILDINQDELSDSVLIIDIDGTVVPDKKNNISIEIVNKITSISKSNKIFLCSNGSPLNAKKFSELMHVEWFECFKPFKNDEVKSISQGKNVLVVGDKFLTDGLFSINIGATFFKVDHLKDGGESNQTKFVYFIDDLVWILKNYFVLMRPWQWIKNLLVFAPVFFAGRVEGEPLLSAGLAMVIFCIFSSLVYTINDIFDVESDKNHPIKRNRPIASGLVTKRQGVLLSVALFVFGSIGLYFLPSIVYIIYSYLFLNIAYTLILKKIFIVDSISVAISYVIRIMAGGVSTSTYVSPWIVACVFFGSLFVVFGKRRAEFYRKKRRMVLDSYSERSLNFLVIFSALMTLAVYSVWSVLGHESIYLIYSTIFVAIALFRLITIIRKDNFLSEFPEVLVFKDPIIFSSFIIWFLYVSFIFYSSIII